MVVTHKMLGHAISVFAGAGIVAEIDFNHTITLGSILIVGVIAGLAGFFTIRSKIAEVWRLEAEGQRVAKETAEAELDREKQRRLKFEREQQELRHDLKAELAACKAQLKATEARTDLTAALEAIKEMSEHGTAVSRMLSEAMSHASELSEQRDLRTQQLLVEIRDKLPAEPIIVRDITE